MKPVILPTLFFLFIAVRPVQGWHLSFAQRSAAVLRLLERVDGGAVHPTGLCVYIDK
jgi:hypothetical protein